MFQRTLLCCLAVFGFASVTLVENNLAQPVFRVGSWCLQQPQPQPQAIYQLPSGEWRVKGGERDLLLNLGLNYMIACAYRLQAEQAMVFMGDSLATAPAAKDFKTSLEYSPANASSATPYQVWYTINQPGGPGNPTWEARVNNGYTSMNTLYSGHAGVHSFISAAEYRLGDTLYHPWAEYISNAVHANAPGTQALVQTCPLPTGVLDALIQTVGSLDILAHCNYPFPTGTPTSGTAFQTALQTSATQFSQAANGLKTHQPGTPFYPIIQAHFGTGSFSYRAPSLEEILCQVNMGLAYGAKGIVYYLYSRARYDATTIEQGLLDSLRNTTSLYTSAQSINTNYQGTGQSLVNIGSNFLPLSWQAGFSIHQNTAEPISSTYKLYDVTAKIPGGATDAEAETYVEVGVLQSGSTNHYMVVNRRCTSTESREITVKFQSTSTNAYLITDIFTGAQKRFLPANADTISYTFTLGPGQGKLLKLEDLGNWSGTISSNTTWSGTVCANSNITVNSGVTLTIAANTKVLFLAAKKLTINGSLQALGTSSQNITFDRSGATGTWNGITFGTNSSGNVNYTTIDHATKGVKIDITNNVTLDHCTIKNFTEQGVYLNASSAMVQYCTIRDAAGGPQGIYSSGNSANPTIANNSIFNMQYGITRIGNPGNAQIRDNAIYACTNAGVQASNSKPAIYKNYFHDNVYGIRLQTGAAPDVHDNDFYANEHGIFLEQSQPDSMNWNNFAYTAGSANYNYSTGLLVNYLASGNNFMAQKWNNFYDGESGSSIDIDNNTAITLLATGQYWRALATAGPINSSSPKATHNSNAGPGGSTGKEVANGNENALAARPQQNILAQNFPNPFNPETQIRFALPEHSLVSLKIYDLSGRMLRALIVSEKYERGERTINWDGRNDEGQPVGSGVYFYRIEAVGLESNHNFTHAQRLALLR